MSQLKDQMVEDGPGHWLREHHDDDIQSALTSIEAYLRYYIISIKFKLIIYTISHFLTVL